MMSTSKNERGAKLPKEYMTGRVSAGLADRLRASVPKGFQFGYVLETAIEHWLSLPADYRLKVLLGETGPTLIDLVNELIDQRIAQGLVMGKTLRPRPGRKPALKDSDSPEPSDHAR
jgi:hypothetical protein